MSMMTWVNTGRRTVEIWLYSSLQEYCCTLEDSHKKEKRAQFGVGGSKKCHFEPTNF